MSLRGNIMKSREGGKVKVMERIRANPLAAFFKPIKALAKTLLTNEETQFQVIAGDGPFYGLKFELGGLTEHKPNSEVRAKLFKSNDFFDTYIY